MRFTKMQGIGNDYVYVNCFQQQVSAPQALARRISDRHFGVGGDGLILICPDPEADCRMRVFNSDGSEADMCGNGIRCVGKYMYDRGLVRTDTVRVATLAGLKTLRLRIRDGVTQAVQVDMGQPRFEAAAVPVLLPGERALSVPLTVDGETMTVSCLSMGNPHCVIFGPDPDTLPLVRLGPLVERHPAFPQRVNAEFAQVITPRHLKMRVWERGAGETLACGTGACAVLAAAVMAGLAEREADVDLPGGTLHVLWDPESGHILQEGPASFVFDGEWPDDV